MAIGLNDVDDVVSYHAPTEDEVNRINALRHAAAHFMKTIIQNTPVCADQAAAIRKVREGLMTANASIVLRGKV